MIGKRNDNRMVTRRALLYAMCLGGIVLASPVRAAVSLSLGNRVVAFCRAHLGQRVGNGECAGLAYQALKSAGAAPRGGPDYPGKGDYVWGRQVVLVESSPSGPKLTGAFSQIQPGDIMQYRDVRFGRIHASHHTAVVNETDPASGHVKAFAQNGGGRRFVFEVEVPLAKITHGWIRVYRPIPAQR